MNRAFHPSFKHLLKASLKLIWCSYCKSIYHCMLYLNPFHLTQGKDLSLYPSVLKSNFVTIYVNSVSNLWKFYYSGSVWIICIVLISTDQPIDFHFFHYSDTVYIFIVFVNQTFTIFVFKIHIRPNQLIVFVVVSVKKIIKYHSWFASKISF